MDSVETVKVLIVDDELGIRVSVERVLRGFSVAVNEFNTEIAFDVTQAESGEEALEIIAADPPHILLLDNKLPGISGLEVLDRISGNGYDIHTIIITAYASIETAVRATKHGAYDFLPKPFTPTDLKTTVRKVSEHLLVARQAKALVEEKRKLRFQFISVLAHELKAPINAVEGYLRILRDRSAGDNEEVYEDFLERCLIRTEYMRKMIIDLLDLTRIESGERPREIAERDVAETVRMAVETATPEAEARGIRIESRIDGAVTLQADQAELEIILNNLVSNAVKYNRGEGRVEIDVRRNGGHVRIAVSDTGIGMTAEESATLFNDFVRIKNEKTNKILGSGLGLSTVKKLALLYGGDVGVESTPGGGSTFTVTLKDAEATAS